jgi:hypothetical protein
VLRVEAVLRRSTNCGNTRPSSTSASICALCAESCGDAGAAVEPICSRAADRHSASISTAQRQIRYRGKNSLSRSGDTPEPHRLNPHGGHPYGQTTSEDRPNPQSHSSSSRYVAKISTHRLSLSGGYSTYFHRLAAADTSWAPPNTALAPARRQTAPAVAGGGIIALSPSPSPSCSAGSMRISNVRCSTSTGPLQRWSITLTSGSPKSCAEENRAFDEYSFLKVAANTPCKARQSPPRRSNSPAVLYRV